MHFTDLEYATPTFSRLIAKDPRLTYGGIISVGIFQARKLKRKSLRVIRINLFQLVTDDQTDKQKYSPQKLRPYHINRMYIVIRPANWNIFSVKLQCQRINITL